MRKCLKPVSGGAVLGSEDNLAALHNSKGLFEGEDLDLRKSTCMQNTCKQTNKPPYFVIIVSSNLFFYIKTI